MQLTGANGCSVTGTACYRYDFDDGERGQFRKGYQYCSLFVLWMMVIRYVSYSNRITSLQTRLAAGPACILMYSVLVHKRVK